jgi:branched-chain amino acid transport system substrate-binding protein
VKNFRNAAFALAAVALITACSKEQPPKQAAAQPIKLGILYDGSGGASFYSTQVVRGIELAVDQINKSGGILKRPVELVRQDDANDSNASPLRTRTLVESGAVATFMTSGSASTLQARGVLAELKVPGVIATNLNDKITQPPNQTFIFNFANTTSQIVKFLTDALKPYKRIAVFGDNSPTGTALANAYKNAFTAAGLNVVDVEFVDVGATDATAPAARMKAANPDAIFISGQAAPEQALFLRAAFAQGLKAPMFQDTTAQVPQYWSLAGAEPLSNLRFIDQVDPNNANTEEVRKAFIAKYGDKDPFLAFYAQGWDLAYILKQSIESANSTDGTAIRDNLEKMANFPAHWGRNGYKISCAQDNHLCSGPEGMVLRAFENGKPGAVVAQ